MSTIARRSKTKKERFILEGKDGSCFELRPIAKSVTKKAVPAKKRVYKKEFIEGLKQAIAEADAGPVYSHKQVKKMFQIK